jgi:hypothetical protein
MWKYETNAMPGLFFIALGVWRLFGAGAAELTFGVGLIALAAVDLLLKRKGRI